MFFYSPAIFCNIYGPLYGYFSIFRPKNEKIAKNCQKNNQRKKIFLNSSFWPILPPTFLKIRCFDQNKTKNYYHNWENRNCPTENIWLASWLFHINQCYVCNFLLLKNKTWPKLYKMLLEHAGRHQIKMRPLSVNRYPRSVLRAVD